jgi:signal transduction histidine kinase
MCFHLRDVHAAGDAAPEPALDHSRVAASRGAGGPDADPLPDHRPRPGDVAVAVFGADLRLLAHTPPLAALLGLTARQVVAGQTLAALLGQVTEAVPTPPWALHRRSPDGRRLDLAAEPLSDGGWSLTVIDATAAATAVEARKQAKARFLTAMNHELRTPLNAVIGFAETLAHDAARPGPKPDPAETEEFARHIRDAGRHLLTLIDDILDLVRLDAGACELAADTVDVGRLVQTTLRGAEAQARKAGLDLAGRDDTGGTWLRGDERRLRRLLARLVSTAVSSARRGASVAVTARRDAARDLRIDVRTSGTALEPPLRAPLALHRRDAPAAGAAAGASLDLQLGRAIAEAHGGALLLDGAPGQDGTATLLLPQARLIAPSPSLQPAQEPP